MTGKFECFDFQIDTDIERVFNDDGTVEYRVKAGAVPQIEPKQKKRLYDEFEGSLARDSEMVMRI